MNLGYRKLTGRGWKIRIHRNLVRKNDEVKIHKKYIRKGLYPKAIDRRRL